MAAKSKRPTFAGASKKLPSSGRAGVDRAKGDHRRAEAKDKRHKATFDLPPELMAELRVASAVSGETLASLAEQGLATELQRLRDEFVDGNPFPMQRKTRRGRPTKA